MDSAQEGKAEFGLELNFESSSGQHKWMKLTQLKDLRLITEGSNPFIHEALEKIKTQMLWFTHGSDALQALFQPHADGLLGHFLLNGVLQLLPGKQLLQLQTLPDVN